ncbi:MAG: P1 family peptidase [Phascolarctobacterium sp.]|nr:P1 family peptidase [Phascolarctobacterium sp.]
MKLKKIVATLAMLGMLTGVGTALAAERPYKEIPVNTIEDVYIGTVEDHKAKTGVTVMLFPKGVMAGVEISGGGPASRETPVIAPTTNPTPLNAVVLGGGSAYGLGASDGVMQYLEEHGIGYDTGVALVPIVVQSDIFDLAYGRADVRPGPKMGYKACENAMKRPEIKSGLYGAGVGATVGTYYSMDRATKAGMGVYAVQLGDVKLAAIVILNACGDIYDPKTGEKIAGLYNEDRTAFVDIRDEVYKFGVPSLAHKNTTIGAILTNAQLDRAQLTKVASMTQNAYARCIYPVGTLYDGDSIYAVSLGDVKADVNAIGTLAAEVMQEAILRAVRDSKISDAEYLANCPK